MKNVIYLASNSVSRKNLLLQAKIHCEVIPQTANESDVNVEQPLSDVVMQIAQLKMTHAVLPLGKSEGDVCFVLTADTMGLTKSGRLLTKPSDRSDAISMLRDCRQGPQTTVTGFCLRKYQWQQGAWQMMQEESGFDKASMLFQVPESRMDFYLDNTPFLSVSGAVSIEHFGGQFCQSLNGSYEAIIGLPMFKIRQTLETLMFF